jgi:hypothetical protein
MHADIATVHSSSLLVIDSRIQESSLYVLSPRKGTTDLDVVFLTGKKCAFLERRATVA